MSAYEKAKKVLKISSVNLQECSVRLAEKIISSEFTIAGLEKQVYRTVSSAYELEAENDDDNWTEYHFIYSVGMRFVSVSEDGETSEESSDENSDQLEQHLEFTAKFKAIYFAREKVEEDGIKAFCDDNVGYHVWPYWREFVQSSCGRLGINNIPVETYFVNNKTTKTLTDSSK